MKELLERQKKEEKVIIFIALGVTTFISTVCLVISLFWLAVSGQIPEIDEPVWKTVAFIQAADYGTDNKGRKEVNNFQDPSETPADRPKTPPKSDNNAPVKPAQGNPAPNFESNTASNQAVVTAPTPSNTNTNTNNNSNSQTSTPAVTTTPKTTTTSPSNTNSGGSDDGNTNTVGNNGNPKAQVLNPNGQFEFGDGIGGPGGRKPLKTDLKGYNVQLEEKIRFDIIVSPAGEVVYCKAKYALHPELANIGKESIMRWKFNDTDPSEGNLKTFVVVSFRLK